ncbi:MAG: DUF4393 domain-containing protein [Rhizobiaceae bacterium]|nr:DUF4393 domain-containing protein [Paracoccaceae bacterium]MBL4733605.1 DUF4393 domain-containing protein [Rhizobiaceae bacterium]
MILNDEEAKAVQETAKAVQEIAKTITALEPHLKASGKFIGELIRYPSEQASGLAGDILGIIRSEIAFRYMSRVEKIMEKRDMTGHQRPVALSFVYPLLQAASLEEDEDISEMFAQLLVNAVDSNYSGTISKSFIQAISGMEPLEAQLLKAIAEAPVTAIDETGMIFTENLPTDYVDITENTSEDNVGQPSLEIEIALTSLRQIGCVKIPVGWGGALVPKHVGINEYGKALFRACSST